MDVERLMSDLSVEQLENIHLSLQKEMEQKKEELREMVGRRYRDVLNASVQVQETYAHAANLAETVSRMRTLAPPDPPRPHRDEVRSLLGFIALNRLLPLIGTEMDLADGLSDTFALLLAEQIHKQMLADQPNSTISSILPTFSQRITRLRRWLNGNLLDELSHLDHHDAVASQLAAIALTQNMGIEQLLDIYFEARKNSIARLLSDEESTLLSVFEEIKLTLQVVEKLFVRGDLSSVLQSISSVDYKHPLLENLYGDETLAFQTYLSKEIEKINRVQRDRKLVALSTQQISKKASTWIESVCDTVRPSVAIISSYYETPNAILEFLKALAIVMNQDWPRVASGHTLYQKMFGNTILEKFKELVCAEVKRLYGNLSTALPSTHLAPPPLFEKRSANHYDPILANGFSKPLHSLVLTFFNELQMLRDLCVQYEKLGMESEASSTREALANIVAEQLINLPSRSNVSELARARLSLALLQADPSLVCNVLNKEPNLIQKCSRSLSQTIESGLINHVSNIANEVFSDEYFKRYMTVMSDSVNSLEFAAEWEQVEVAEIGVLGVPIGPSALLMSAFCGLSHRLASESLTHQLSRSVRRSLGETVAQRLYKLFTEVLNVQANLPQRVWIQALFDLKIVQSVIPHFEVLRSLTSQFETKLDPFELAIIAQPISTNIRLAAMRVQLLWSCVVTDVVPLKESTFSSSFLAVTDLIPRPSEHPQRIPAIPRLDRSIGENGLKKMRSRDTRSNKLLIGSDSKGKGSGASLTAMYEKMTGFTGGWFGGN